MPIIKLCILRMIKITKYNAYVHYYIYYVYLKRIYEIKNKEYTIGI